MRERRWYPVLYMFAVTAVFSAIVIGFMQITRARVQANEALAFERAVITVLPQLDTAGMSSLEIHRTFSEQITAPVLWVDTLLELAGNGVTTFVEVGPGRVLSGLAKRTLKDVRILSLDRLENLEAVQEQLLEAV